jgi:N-acetylglutamate synthase-like GNAT family acetyltransferase
MRTRLARPEDVAAISRLIAQFVAQGLLLPRSPEEVRAHLNRFIVLTELVPALDAPPGTSTPSERLLGCVALEPYGPDLAEIRSLAVRSDEQGRGLGGRLLEAALCTARRRKTARIFAVTHAPKLFEHHGFSASARENVPEKIERDCKTCSKRRRCKLVTLVAVVCPERLVLPVLAEGSKRVCVET